MVELVDTLDLGSSAAGMGVQVPSLADFRQYFDIIKRELSDCNERDHPA